MGFPPAEAELAAAQMAAEQAEVEHDPEPDHGQLDALSGMVERQAPAVAEPAEVADVVEAEPAATESAETVTALDAATPTEPSAPVQDTVEAEDFDPLTAPIENVVEYSEPHEPDTAATEDVAAPDEIVITHGRTFGVQRLAQVFIMGAALSNLALAGLEAIGGGAMVVVSLALVSLAIWTAAVITFLHWVSRAYLHVASTSAVPQRHGHTMAVAGWMIPVAGFVVGYRVLQDLWAGSDPATRGDADAGPARARLIDVWLLGVVTATLFAYALPFALGDSVLWGALSSVGLLAAAFALIQVMTTIGGWVTDVPPAPAAAEIVDEGTVSTRADDLQPTAPVAEPDPVPVD
jgi:hypothetical protein